MKNFFLVIIFIFLINSKVSAGPLVIIKPLVETVQNIIKPLVETVQEFMEGLKIFPKSLDETTESSINKTISQNSSEELANDDIPKKIVGEANETTSTARNEKTNEDGIDNKMKLALPAAGGIVYNEKKKEQKTKEKGSSEVIKNRD